MHSQSNGNCVMKLLQILLFVCCHKNDNADDKKYLGTHEECIQIIKRLFKQKEYIFFDVHAVDNILGQHDICKKLYMVVIQTLIDKLKLMKMRICSIGPCLKYNPGTCSSTHTGKAVAFLSTVAGNADVLQKNTGWGGNT